MKKIIVFIFVLGLLPALINAAESCECVTGEVSCLNKCALSKANAMYKNVQANKQNTVNAVKNSTNTLTKNVKNQAS